MSKVYWRVARTQRDIDDAQRVRWQVLVEERNIRASARAVAPRDVSLWDTLATTHHVLVQCGPEVIGTARLALANHEVAGLADTHFGFESEQIFDLAAVTSIAGEVAEVARMCVSRQWLAPGTAALYEGLYALSRQLGVRYWLGAVDCQTADAGEACRMQRLLVQAGLTSNSLEVHARERGAATPCADVSVPVSAPRLASTLAAFTRRFGARGIGAPSRHPVFARYVMPMLADLSALPETTLARFDRSALAPSPSSANTNSAPVADPFFNAIRSAS